MNMFIFSKIILVYIRFVWSGLYVRNNKATAAAVISHLRISNNGELKELEEGVKAKSQQLEKSLRP